MLIGRLTGKCLTGGWPRIQKPSMDWQILSLQALPGRKQRDRDKAEMNIYSLHAANNLLRFDSLQCKIRL